MINNFEEQTAPLSEYEEKTLVPVFIRGLTTKIGKDNAITNGQIVTAMKGAGYRISDARARNPGGSAFDGKTTEGYVSKGVSTNFIFVSYERKI